MRTPPHSLDTYGNQHFSSPSTMRGAGLNASWSGVIPTMGLSVPVVMDPLCGIARGCDDELLVCEWRDGHDDIFAPGDGDHDDGDGW